MIMNLLNLFSVCVYICVRACHNGLCEPQRRALELFFSLDHVCFRDQTQVRFGSKLLYLFS